ncbi:MAG TPA: site-2 protease family protein [Polyangiaceae bacterium]|jgi:Zn-dependent protease|nr:site-2 protease family protein [Polyangiaceae bacterium]
MSSGRPQNRRAFGGVRLGQLFGVEIRLDFTLIIVFFLVATSFGQGTLPGWHPDWPTGLVWVVAIGAAILFFASVLLHELSHALVARAQGIPVRGITLFMLGGVAQIEKEPSSPGREFTMAIVGPLTSIAIGVACSVFVGARLSMGPQAFAEHPSEAFQALGPVATLLAWLGPLNLVLGVFNLVPGFPLDGGRVLRAILWAISGDRVRASRWAAFSGQVFGWGLTALGIVMAFGSVFPVVGGGFVQGIWFVLLGFYLTSAAHATSERVMVQSALDDVPVRTLMLTRFDTVEPGMPVQVFVDEHLLGSEQRCFPVTSDGRFEGLVSLADVRAARGDWDTRKVGNIMTPAGRVGTVSPDANAADALDELARRDVDQLAVVDARGDLVGLLRRRDIVRWLSIRDSRELLARRSGFMASISPSVPHGGRSAHR